MHYITNINQKVYQRFFQYHSFGFASQVDKCFHFHRLKLYYLFDIRQIYYFPIHIMNSYNEIVVQIKYSSIKYRRCWEITSLIIIAILISCFRSFRLFSLVNTIYQYNIMTIKKNVHYF